MKNIFSHRGLPRAYAENTFTGINKSYEYVDFAEVDVRITKDNELILHHDPNIGDININEVSYKELSNLLQQLDIEEIAIKNRSQFSGKVNFEIKTDSLNQTQKDILFQKMLSILNYEDIISSFDWQMILSFKHVEIFFRFFNWWKCFGKVCGMSHLLNFHLFFPLCESSLLGFIRL